MFNPTIIRALVYAGLISNVLAILVCLMFKEWSIVSDKSINLAMWTGAYLIHKKLGTW